MPASRKTRSLFVLIAHFRSITTGFGEDVMSVTIEDMLVISQEKYQMKLEAGRNAWSNSISWILLLEDVTIIRNFSGKELAVTTGLGFQTEEKLLRLAECLCEQNAAGLLINTGYYIHEIPQAVISFCDKNDLPLLTVPWDVYLADLIKDFSIRIFLQGSTDEQISAAMIRAIEKPEEPGLYQNDLLPWFDTDGSFQVFLITTGTLDKMDTVERRRLEYRIQLSITNITHNASFFYYDSCFVMIVNDVEEAAAMQIIEDFLERARIRLPDYPMFVGAGSRMADLSSLHISYLRAKAAVSSALQDRKELVCFDQMGIRRLIWAVTDRSLLEEMSTGILKPLIEYDRLHEADYVKTLELYLKYDESIQAVAAEMFTHRNTVMYRLKNIRELLGTDFRTPEEKLELRIACLIRSTFPDESWGRFSLTHPG